MKVTEWADLRQAPFPHAGMDMLRVGSTPPFDLNVARAPVFAGGRIRPISGRPFSGQNRRNRTHQQIQVEPQRPILDVVHV